MYSYEQRMAAVKLYIKLEHRASEVKRMLGYPSKKYIRQWYLIFKKEGDLPKTYKRPAFYSQEQKTIAIEHYFSHGQCATFTMKKLGYPCRQVLSLWISETDKIQSNVYTQRKNKRAKWTETQKQQAVIEFCLSDNTVETVADSIGVSRQTLYKWKEQLLSNNYNALMKKKKDSSNDTTQLEQQINELRQERHALQLENDILKKANELLKKDQGISHQNLTNREKTLLIDALLFRYKLSELLNYLSLPRSSYFYHKARMRLPDKYAEIRTLIKDIFADNLQCYGYRRIQAVMKKSGTSVAEKVVRRLMKEESLVAFSSRKKRNYSSYYGELSPPVDNIIKRDFKADKPNTKWLTDITEFRIAAGKVYLSPMIDCFDGLVVSWSISTRPTAELANTMLDQAITVLGENERPIIHSDRGGHYRWPGWIKRMEEAELTRSMSKKGCSPDNAACEGFFGRLKTEFFYPRDWHKKSVKQLIEEIDCYINWYNQKRIKVSLGFKSPVEYRESLNQIA